MIENEADETKQQQLIQIKAQIDDLISGDTQISEHIKNNISQKLNTTAPTPQTNDINPNTMMNFMLVMIVIMSLNFSVALSLYWIASTLFTIVQNLIVIKTSKKKEVK